MKDILHVSIIKTLIFNWVYFAKRGRWGIFLKFPCIISRNVNLKTIQGEIDLCNEYCGMIKIGFGDVAIFANERSVWMNRGKVKFYGKARIGRGTRIANTGELIFGANFEITAKSQIICRERIEFGNDCLVSWDTLIMDTDFHKIYDEQKSVLNPNKCIRIGNHVWIGCRTTILKGTEIGDESVVAAGSVITGKNCGNAILGQSKIIRENISWSY